jgi:SAM-dependent methyltransferase
MDRARSNTDRRRADYQWFLGPNAVVSQRISQLEALNRCFGALEQKHGVDLAQATILDVGSKSGDGLGRLVGLGFGPKQLYGIDFVEEYIDEGREKYPGFNLYHGDATHMDVFDDEQFDVTMLLFTLSLIADDKVRSDIAAEMLRVTKLGGHLLVFDWILGRESAYIIGVPFKKIKQYFEVEDRSEYVSRHPGALWPPIGRPISTFASFIYPMVQRLLPPAVGAKLTLLRRVK